MSKTLPGSQVSPVLRSRPSPTERAATGPVPHHEGTMSKTLSSILMRCLSPLNYAVEIFKETISTMLLKCLKLSNLPMLVLPLR